MAQGGAYSSAPVPSSLRDQRMRCPSPWTWKTPPPSRMEPGTLSPSQPQVQAPRSSSTATSASQPAQTFLPPEAAPRPLSSSPREPASTFDPSQSMTPFSPPQRSSRSPPLLPHLLSSLPLTCRITTSLSFLSSRQVRSSPATACADRASTAQSSRPAVAAPSSSTCP